MFLSCLVWVPSILLVFTIYSVLSYAYKKSLLYSHRMSTSVSTWANAGHRIISFAAIEICEGAYSLASPRIAPNYSTSLLIFPQVFHSCNLLGSCWSLGRFFSLPERHVWVTALVLALVVVLLDLCLVWGANTAWDDRPVYSFNLPQDVPHRTRQYSCRYLWYFKEFELIS